jgi:hypothetical protein
MARAGRVGRDARLDGAREWDKARERKREGWAGWGASLSGRSTPAPSAKLPAWV